MQRSTAGKEHGSESGLHAQLPDLPLMADAETRRSAALSFLAYWLSSRLRIFDDVHASPGRRVLVVVLACAALTPHFATCYNLPNLIAESPAMFEFKPDYEKTRERIDALWERELIDRPVVMFALLKPPEEWVPWPESRHATSEARWTDAQYQADLALAAAQNQEFLGDTLPVAFPNLGPEIFSALYGCPIHFGDYGTSWSDPILYDWGEADQIQLDWNSPWLAKLHEMTDALLEAMCQRCHSSLCSVGAERTTAGRSSSHARSTAFESMSP
jgi:hypothetical protein